MAIEARITSLSLPLDYNYHTCFAAFRNSSDLLKMLKKEKTKIMSENQIIATEPNKLIHTFAT